MNFKRCFDASIEQVFSQFGEPIQQDIFASNEVEFKTEDGDPINVEDMPLKGEEYQCIEMVQPYDIICKKEELLSLSECIQDDLLCCLAGFVDNDKMTQVCQIIVNRFNELF